MAIVQLCSTVWGMTVGFSNAVGCLCVGSAWYMVQKREQREGECYGWVEGPGLLGWINTVDTKGLGSRDLLFS